MSDKKILIATIPGNESDFPEFQNMLKTYLEDMFPHLRENPSKEKLLHVLCITSHAPLASNFVVNNLTEFLSRAKITRGLAINKTNLLDTPYSKTKEPKPEKEEKFASSRRARIPIASSYQKEPVAVTTTLADKVRLTLKSGAGVYDVFIFLPTRDIPENVLVSINTPHQLIGSNQLYEV